MWATPTGSHWRATTTTTATTPPMVYIINISHVNEGSLYVHVISSQVGKHKTFRNSTFQPFLENVYEKIFRYILLRKIFLRRFCYEVF